MSLKLLKPHRHRGRDYPASTAERAVILTGLRPDQEQWLAALGVGEVVSATPAPAPAEVAPAPTPARASKRAGA